MGDVGAIVNTMIKAPQYRTQPLAPGGVMRDAVRTLLSEVARLKPHAGDESVHLSRKRLKRIRAALRLQRAALGEALYRAANRQVRDAARPLTRLRDAAVLVKSLEQCSRHIHGHGWKSRADQASRLFLAELEATRQQLTNGTLRRSAARLNDINRRLASARPKATDLESAQRGMKNIYKKGRAACADAQRWPTPERLHEWRKQAQYLSNEATLMHSLLGARFKKIRRRSRKLVTLLGEDHDLVLLQAKLIEFLGSGLLRADKSARSAFSRELNRRRKKLQAAGFRLGKRLYRRSPSKFAAATKREFLAVGGSGTPQRDLSHIVLSGAESGG